MTELMNSTVAEVVAKNIKTANIFKKHGIDFCCGGRISIEEACNKNNAVYEDVLNDLFSISSKPEYDEDFSWWDVEVLMDHIIEHHHDYMREILPILMSYSDKVAKVHGAGAPEVIKVNLLLHEIEGELMEHLVTEEEVLFPIIRKLNSRNKSTTQTGSESGTANQPIEQLEDEHNKVGDVLKQLRLITNNYQAPDWACNSYKALYATLEEFENDMHIHIHLENNVLHPAAIKLQEQLAQAG